MGREHVAEEPHYRVVIDCDPGVDDALALLAALAAPVFQLDFISTVAGNAPVDRTTANALAVVALSGRTDVPVFRGADKPLERPLEGAEDRSLPVYAAVAPNPTNGSPAGEAHEALRDWLRQPSVLPKRLIATGPLTNIAAVLLQDATALSDLDALYVMGGSLSRHGGRFSPVAETNFYLDPEAAAFVMRSGAPIRLFDYDATSLGAMPTDAGELVAIESRLPEPLRREVGTWMQALYTAQVVRQRRETWSIHDLCPVAGAAGVEPGRWETVSIQVATGVQRGALDTRPARLGDPLAIQVARDVDAEEVLGFLTDWLGRLPAVERRHQTIDSGVSPSGKPRSCQR